MDRTDLNHLFTEKAPRWSSGYDCNGIFKIIVSHNTGRILYNWDDTLWSHYREVISQIELARVSSNPFVSSEEAREMANKRDTRWRAKRKPNTYP